MTAKGEEKPVFHPGGASRLLEGKADLTDDERALLLAMVGVDTESGSSLGEQERAALDKLKAQVEGYDTEELAQAARYVVTAKSKKDRKLEWPELKRRRRRHPSEE